MVGVTTHSRDLFDDRDMASLVLFFFSSSRRHTRFKCDWSSDVCSSDLLPRRGRSYVLKVRGQSMIDEQIKDGDYVVVHERNTADNGQMVIAQVPGAGATVKRYYREPGGWIPLQPAHPPLSALPVNPRDGIAPRPLVDLIRNNSPP